jgi:hypothetical protein
MLAAQIVAVIAKESTGTKRFVSGEVAWQSSLPQFPVAYFLAALAVLVRELLSVRKQTCKHACKKVMK